MNTLLAAPAFQASQASTLTGFAGLAAVVTFSLLAGVAQIADRQVDAELMAQASPARLTRPAETNVPRTSD